MSELHIHHVGGAAARVGRDSSPFPHRDAPYVANFISRWIDPATDDEQIAWAVTSLPRSPSTRPAARTSTSYRRGAGRGRAAYGDDAYARLQASSANYDPDNAFHRNQNVVPA